MQSPSLYPTAPPTKKQRSNDGARVMNGAGNPSNGGSSAADALTRRRVALEKLRRQQARPIANPNDLLAKARGQLKGTTPPYMNGSSGPPPTLNGSGPPPTSSSSAFPPPMPSPSNPKSLVKRTSDIFPHVEKEPTRAPSSSARAASSARAQRPPVVTIPAFKSEKKTAPVSVPPVSSSRPPRSTSSVPPIRAPSPPVAPLGAPSPAVANATVPPPVAPTPTADAAIIARRLDFAASNDRSKSAPPVRPPPPPPTPPQSAEAPPLGRLPPLTKAPPTPPATGTTVSLSPTASLSPPLTSVVNNSHRPSPITPTLDATDVVQPSRREFLTSMRQYVDSPSSSKTKNSELELLKELKMVNRDKEDAFRQVVRLRQQVTKLQTTDRKTEEFQALVEIADQKGERAALKWAREQMPESKSKSSSSFMFQSPFKTRSASPSRRALTPAIGVGVRKRVATPHPKRKGVGQEVVDTKYLSMAADTNPDEFDSELATYVVRRPYAPHHNADFWTDVGELSIHDYNNHKTALVSDSLEICAKIKLDGSILMLSGKSNVRHKKPRSSKWKRFDNIDENDDGNTTLGSVMFIDEQANEGEYWLDEIYEQAMSTRDTYCSSLLATATALKSNIVQQQQVQQVQPMMMQQQQQPPMMQQQQQPPSFNNTAPSNGGEKPPGLLTVPSNETMQPQQPQAAASTPPMMPSSSMPPMMPSQAAASLPPSQQHQQPQMQQQQQPTKLGAPNETAIPKDDSTVVASNKEDKVKEKKPEEKKNEKKKIKKKKAPPPPDDEDEGASDILSVMLGSIFLAVFNLLHYTLVKLPIQILMASFFATVAGIVWALLWLWIAHDGGAGEMGAHLGYGFNQAGIQ